MKSLKFLALVVVAIMSLVACDKNPDEQKTPTGSGSFDTIENEWKLISVNGTPNEFNVYISFEAGFFAIYQQVYTLDYKFYDGEYKVEGGKLTGEYMGGGAWKCAYTGGVSEDGNTLTLKSEEENPITCVYEACTIPEIVKEEALAGTRALDITPFL